MTFKMPSPRPEDLTDELVLTRMDDDYLNIRIGDRYVLVSEYTAAQIFGCLALFLEIPLSIQVKKAITLGGRNAPRTEPPGPFVTLRFLTAANRVGQEEPQDPNRRKDEPR